MRCSARFRGSAPRRLAERAHRRIGDDHPDRVAELRRYNADRRRRLTDTIAADVAAGDFPAGLDPDLAAQAMAGALFYRRLMTNETLDPSLVPALVEMMLGGQMPPGGHSR